jgi:hypothetical protein
MAINAKQTHTTTGAKEAIIVSRHNDPNYSLDVDIGGGATYTIEATINQLNRADVTPVWHPLPSAINLTTALFDKIEHTPLEAIRINISAITDNVTFQVMQNT